jgi:IS30 family transposase
MRAACRFPVPPCYGHNQALNDETQTLARYNAHLLPVAEAAGRLGVHESTVRRRAKRLNGQTAEVA